MVSVVHGGRSALRPLQALPFEACVPAPDTGVHQLAAELHDGLSQELFAAELELHELRLLPDLSPAARESIERVRARVSAGSAQLRSALLAALAGDCSGLPVPAVVDGVAELLDCFGRIHQIETSMQLEGEGPKPTPVAASVLLRAVREGLANVGKHADATRVAVLVRRGRRQWAVEVNDDGPGDPQAVRRAAAAARSFGLSSLGSDAARVGGRLTFAMSPQLRGLQLRVVVPVVAGGAASLR